jgi:2-polyprenyl-6-methoxyphenol hydroxylase-like FAD-dependent oxidoreductase
VDVANSASSDIFIIDDILQEGRESSKGTTHLAVAAFTHGRLYSVAHRVNRIPVLIVGAGPTGLVLALWLTRAGIAVRIIDRAAEPGTTSRALGVQARTLELYRELGIADEVVEGGVQVPGANFWVGGTRLAHISIADIGKGMSPFAGLIDYPQDAHERMLIAALSARGVTVERRTELLHLEERDASVRVTLECPDDCEEQCEVSYLAGCDGAHSAVRSGLGIGFPGGTYDELFYVADVQLTGPVANQEVHIDLGTADFLAVFPLKGEGRVRLIGTVLAPTDAEQRNLTFDDVSPRAIQDLALTIHKVNWFSTYRVHHRVANGFRKGRAFLLGDAAHIHSPAGAQGMNTGIGDAVNLAWKLAAVLKGEATPELLDSYEPERIGFARRLVSTTDRVFTFATRRGPVAAFVRTKLAPVILPMLFRERHLRPFIFRTISQIGIHYRDSALSMGTAGKVRGGDRLPWVPMRDTDNFAPLQSRAWQAHIYGEPRVSTKVTCAELRIPLHIFPWSAQAGRAGLARSAFYLIRPDGYVALADSHGGANELRAYLTRRGLSSSGG